jgi:signal transduction histidine kinase
VRRTRGIVGLPSHTLLVSRDGSERPIADSGAPIRDGDGPVHGVVLVFRDQTEERRREGERLRAVELEADSRRAREANRLKSDFLASMSHELRTPLNAILGFSELLHTEQVGPLLPLQREFLGDVLNSGRHLLQLINDVLDLSKVEAGKLEFHAETIQGEPVVLEVVSNLREAAAAKRIRLTTRVESLGELSLDPLRLKQVLYNYLSNAIKFTPDDGHVETRLLLDGPERFLLEVEDNGGGISQADQQRLFVEFQQLESGARRRCGGTGLGLALTKRLVEAQGGAVGVRSVVGRGSVFFASLPRVAA